MEIFNIELKRAKRFKKDLSKVLIIMIMPFGREKKLVGFTLCYHGFQS